MLIRLWSLLTACALLVGSTSSLTASPPDIEGISSALERFVSSGQISGGVTLVVDAQGIRHLGCTGEASLEQHREMTPETLFWIASMTKPITATAVMILVERGALEIDDPVARHLPEFAGLRMEDGSAPKTELTVWHLMTHTNGLGRLNRPEPGEPETRSLEEQCRLMARLPLRFEPGSKWEYGNGLSVCGRIIEVLSGMSYEQFVQREILDPLKMKDTTFYLTDETLKRHATPYRFNEARTALVPGSPYFQKPDPGHRQTPNPSGGLFSTALDLSRFYRMILNDGVLEGTRILSPLSVRRMTTLQTGEIVTGFTPGNGWGLGWCIVRHPQGVSGNLSPETFGHGGAYGTQVWIDRPRGFAQVLLIQRSDLGNSDGSPIREAFHRAVVENLNRR